MRLKDFTGMPESSYRQADLYAECNGTLVIGGSIKYSLAKSSTSLQPYLSAVRIFKLKGAKATSNKRVQELQPLTLNPGCT